MGISSKKEIRAQVKKSRREATAEQIRKNSDRICETFLGLSEYAEAEVVFAYMDCNSSHFTGVGCGDKASDFAWNQ